VGPTALGERLDPELLRLRSGLLAPALGIDRVDGESPPAILERAGPRLEIEPTLTLPGTVARNLPLVGDAPSLIERERCPDRGGRIRILEWFSSTLPIFGPDSPFFQSLLSSYSKMSSCLVSPRFAGSGLPLLIAGKSYLGSLAMSPGSLLGRDQVSVSPGLPSRQAAHIA
jgi:hypothetical protein